MRFSDADIDRMYPDPARAALRKKLRDECRCGETGRCGACDDYARALGERTPDRAAIAARGAS